MREQRHLVLHRETLTELPASELTTVGGGSLEPALSGALCIDIGSGSVCESVLRPCSGGCPTNFC